MRSLGLRFLGLALGLARREREGGSQSLGGS